MHDLSAFAVRNGGVIDVTISGKLADSCHAASVVDQYPGGAVVYATDPGVAQVFIEETVKHGSSICLMMLVPWVGHASLPDADHNDVDIFVNREKKLTVKVSEESALTQYRVISHIEPSPDGGLIGCSVIPADAKYLAIFRSVFGPAPRAECEQWKAMNCVAISPEP